MTTLRSCLAAALFAFACSKTEDPAPETTPKDPPAETAKDAAAGKPAPAADAAKAAPAPDAAAAPPAADAGAAAAPPAGGDDDAPPKNLKVLPKKWSKKQVVELMKTRVGKGLGVKCDFCHDTKDFAADGNEHKQAARKMMKMTADLNAKFFDGKEELTCFTCHKGHDEPEDK